MPSLIPVIPPSPSGQVLPVTLPMPSLIPVKSRDEQIMGDKETRDEGRGDKWGGGQGDYQDEETIEGHRDKG